MAPEAMKVNGTCPSLETIGAFVDDRLKDREHEVIADHVASCEACYFTFTEAARYKATGGTREIAPPAPKPIPIWQSRGVLAGLAAAAMLVIAVNVWSPGGDADQQALDHLVTAVGTARTFEPRLTGGFAYAPVRGPVRGANDITLSPDVRIAIAEIEKQTAARPVAASAAMIAGDTSKAIGILEATAKTGAPTAKIYSDLAAAYLIRAERTSTPTDASIALAMANRALELDRLMPEALFNRALALEANKLTSEARTAWQAYLTIDNRSGWADEARARLRVLSPQP
jgi:hypothetical protein